MKYIVVSLVLLLAMTAMAADVAGKWKASTQGPDGTMEIVFNLKVDGTKITGSSETPMGPMQITEGKVDGDSFVFTVESDQFKVVHKGTVTGDEMKITAQIGDQNIEMTAKRVK